MERWRPVAAETTVEYRLAQWIAQHPPQGRVFASGGLRFRFNSWFDIPQVGGGFETGLRNRVPVDLAYKVRTGQDTQETLRDLKELGAEYVVVHGPKSREYYRDFLRPERIAAILPAVYHIEDDTIYALPTLEGLGGKWKGTDTFKVYGPKLSGEPVPVKINWDPGWRATQDGRDVAIDRDRLGFIVLRPASAGPIELRYHGTAEQRIMAGLSVIAWAAAIMGLRVRLRGRHRLKLDTGM